MASADSVEAFLAREQEELAGIMDDDFVTPAINPPEFQLTSPLANGSSNSAVVDDFESAFITPPVAKHLENGNEALLNGNENGIEEIASDIGTPNTLSALPKHQQAAMRREASPTPPLTREEPEKIKAWRQLYKERLERKDMHEEAEKKKLREQAKRDLEDWNKKRNEQLDAAKKHNRALEQEFIDQRDSVQAGQEWERVVRMCEFNPKSSRGTKDVSRFRGLLLQLKNKPVPIKTAQK